MTTFFVPDVPISFKVNRWSCGRIGDEIGPVRVLEAPLGPNHKTRLGRDLMAEPQPTLVKVENPQQCVIEGCGGGIKARGYCNRHYLQVVFHGKEPTLERRQDTTSRNAEGHKRCVSCKGWKPEDGFHKAKNSKDGYASTCASCYRRKYREKVIKRHGLSSEKYNNLLVAQGGRCICGASGPFVIDHDHSCCPGKHGCEMCVRGLLCQPCNKTLGFARDDADILRKLAGYVDAGVVR